MSKYTDFQDRIATAIAASEVGEKIDNHMIHTLAFIDKLNQVKDLPFEDQVT